MSIALKKPYKIISERHKRYGEHYSIPASKALVIPIKEYGAEVSCDVRWEDEQKDLKVLHNVVFINDNLIPVSAQTDEDLYTIWRIYYGIHETQ